jgi:hypothetical protein
MQLGLAMHNHVSVHNGAFPPSAEIVATSPKGNTIGGYSFLVKVLPYLEYDALYKSLPQTVPNGDLDALVSKNAALATAMDTSLGELHCPSNNNNVFENPTSNPPRFAFTNYKAMGATTRNSLLMAANPSGTPPYGTASLHPDGALFPSAGNLPLASIADGTSHTITIMETIDDKSSRWMVGAECTLVGLPFASNVNGKVGADGVTYPYYCHSSFDNTYGDGSGVTRAGLRTFLMYDFSPSGADCGKYEDPGWSKPPAYGPSSAHPVVAIVGTADGSVMALSKRCDAANLFFMITKNGSDPFNIP